MKISEEQNAVLGSLRMVVYSLIFKLQRTIYCANRKNISNLFGGMKEKV